MATTPEGFDSHLDPANRTSDDPADYDGVCCHVCARWMDVRDAVEFEDWFCQSCAPSAEEMALMDAELDEGVVYPVAVKGAA